MVWFLFVNFLHLIESKGTSFTVLWVRYMRPLFPHRRERLLHPLPDHLRTRYIPLYDLDLGRRLVCPAYRHSSRELFSYPCSESFSRAFLKEPSQPMLAHPTVVCSGLSSYSWFCLFTGLSNVMGSPMMQLLMAHPLRFPTSYVESWKSYSSNRPHNESQRGRVMERQRFGEHGTDVAGSEDDSYANESQFPDSLTVEDSESQS